MVIKPRIRSVLIAAIAIGAVMLIVACATSPAEEESPYAPTPVADNSPSPIIETKPSPSSATEQGDLESKEDIVLPEYPESIQLNISIEELNELFDRKIVETYQGGGYTVDIERIYKDYLSENGVLIAQFYFDKPVLSGEGEAVDRINAAFDKEATGFFYGTEDSVYNKWGRFDVFDFYVALAHIHPGEESMENEALEYNFSPSEASFRNSIKTTVTYLDETILSVIEDFYWHTIGVMNLYHYGMTFDMKTGELLPVSYFVGDDLESFKQLVKDTLYEGIEEETPENKSYLDRWSEDWVKAALAEQEDYEFSDYKYYYDGEHIILIVYGGMEYYAFDRLVQLPGTYSPVR